MVLEGAPHEVAATITALYQGKIRVEVKPTINSCSPPQVEKSLQDQLWQLPNAILDLSLEVLGLDPESLSLLKLYGLKYIGDLLDGSTWGWDKTKKEVIRLLSPAREAALNRAAEKYL